MPKIVTFQPIHYTNAGKEDDTLHVIHCLKCGEHIVITDAKLTEDEVPIRRTDKALVLDARVFTIRVNTKVNPECIRIQRQEGIEHQWRHYCPSCSTIVGYQCVSQKEPLELLYLVPHRIKLPF